MTDLTLSAAGTTPLTMTSTELVKYINTDRAERSGMSLKDFLAKDRVKQPGEEAVLRHDHFMAKAPEVLGGGVPNFRDTRVNPQNGQSYDIYRFPKREACLMAMSYSYELQAKVFDHMTALEAKLAAPVHAIPQTYAAALLEAGRLAEQVEIEKAGRALEKVGREQAEAKVEVLEPKALALDRVAEAKGSFCLTDAAKMLQIPARQLPLQMHQIEWIYQRPGTTTWVAYSDKLAQGLLEHKVVTGEKTGGQKWASVQVRVTAKGLAKLAEILSAGPAKRATKKGQGGLFS